MFHIQHHSITENNDSGKDGHYNMQVSSKNPTDDVYSDWQNR